MYWILVLLELQQKLHIQSIEIRRFPNQRIIRLAGNPDTGLLESSVSFSPAKIERKKINLLSSVADYMKVQKYHG